MPDISLLLENLSYPESPEWSESDGCLYFVEWAADRLNAWQDGLVRLVHTFQPDDGPSAVVQAGDGSMWVCLYSARQVVQLTTQGEVLQRVNGWAGGVFKGPNDLVSDEMGGLYFTDSGNYNEDWISGLPAGSIYYLSPGNQVTRIAGELCYPNGIALSPDGMRLFVNEHRRNRCLVYDILSPGVLSAQQVFYRLDDQCLLDSDVAYELGPDGMCFDNDGKLWIAHYGGGKLVAIETDGKVNRSLHLPKGRKPTNIGLRPNSNELYISEAEEGLLYVFRQSMHPQEHQHPQSQ